MKISHRHLYGHYRFTTAKQTCSKQDIFFWFGYRLFWLTNCSLDNWRSKLRRLERSALKKASSSTSIAPTPSTRRIILALGLTLDYHITTTRMILSNRLEENTSIYSKILNILWNYEFQFRGSSNEWIQIKIINVIYSVL